MLKRKRTELVDMFSEVMIPARKKKTRMRYRVAVIGGGSWATAIVKILSANLEHIHWWVREEEIVEGVSTYGHNPLFLSSVYINPKDVKISTLRLCHHGESSSARQRDCPARPLCGGQLQATHVHQR